MDRQQLIDLRARRPFVPFRVSLTNGESIEITRPTSIGFGLSKVHLVYPDRRRHRMVNLGEVASAEPLQSVG